MAKTSEPELGRAVMRFLKTRPGHQATMRVIIKRLSSHITLTSEDLEPSGKRLGEAMWEQRVRNLKSHSATPGNVIAEGYVERPSRGNYRLTASGALHLKSSP